MENIEIWKSLDFLGYPNYKVSNFGRVKSLNYKCSGKEKILKLVKNKLGYIQITLSKEGERKNFQVHKLVALAFLKNTYNLPMINHKDENPLNNHVDNLEWCTAKHNANYGTRNERVSKTSKTKKINCKSILQYTLDGNFIREWESIKQASQELNINNSHIGECCKGRYKTCGGYTWKYK